MFDTIKAGWILFFLCGIVNLQEFNNWSVKFEHSPIRIIYIFCFPRPWCWELEVLLCSNVSWLYIVVFKSIIDCNYSQWNEFLLHQFPNTNISISLSLFFIFLLCAHFFRVNFVIYISIELLDSYDAEYTRDYFKTREKL